MSQSESAGKEWCYCWINSRGQKFLPAWRSSEAQVPEDFLHGVLLLITWGVVDFPGWIGIARIQCRISCPTPAEIYRCRKTRFISCDWLKDMNKLQTLNPLKKQGKTNVYKWPTRMGNIFWDRRTAMNAVACHNLCFPAILYTASWFFRFLSFHTLPVQTPPLNAAQRDTFFHLSRMIARLHGTNVFDSHNVMQNATATELQWIHNISKRRQTHSHPFIP